MAVDQGGFRYTIQVRDQFSRQLSAFRSQIRALRTEIGDLRTAQAGLNATRQRSAGAQAGQDRAQLDRLRAIQAGVRQQQQVEQLRARVLRQQQREASQAAREEITLFRRRAQEQATASRQRQASLRREEVAQQRANRQVQQSSRGFLGLRRDILSTDGAVNRLSFTFRRLFGIFAAFQAVRFAAGGFTSLIRDSIAFNQTVEDSQISLASLFSAVGQVRNAQGELVEGAEAFGLAQAEAARQTKLLQADAVATIATFQELLRAFQAGVGPGLEAGLQLDQIREITVRVSQAAAALTVPQNQLIEEIRSLLRGTIQARTTIVASVLGITNEDIRSAKEAGNLFEFLVERLDGFRFAALATEQSFTGLFARLQDSLQIAGGQASAELFDQLKISFEELAGAIIALERDAEGKVIGILPQEGAVLAAIGLFDRLGDAVRILREGLSQVTFGELGTVLASIGVVAQVLGAGLAGFIQGLISSIDVVVRGLSTVASLFGGADGILPVVEAFGQVIGQLAGPLLALVTLSSSLRITWFLLSPAIHAARVAMLAFLTVSQGVLAVVGRLPGRLFTFAGIILASLAGFQQLASAILGVDVSIRDSIKFLQLTFAEFWGRVTRLGEIAFKTFANNLVGFFEAPLQTIASGFIGLFSGVLQLISGAAALLGISEEARASIEQGIFTLEQFRDGFSPPPIFDVDQSRADLDTFLQESQAKFTALAEQVAANDANRNVLFDADQIDQDLEDLLGIVEGLQDRLGAAFEEVTGFNFDELAQQFAQGLIDPEAVAGQLEEAVKAFIEGRGAQGAEDVAGPLTKFFEGIVKNFENGLSIIRPLVQQTASFISDSIVDAFDPTTDTDLLERFARFLQQIAKLIIQQLVQVAIARAVLGLTGVPGGAGGGGVGLAEGGEIPGGHDAPRMARPKGLDPRDTTPIFAQPGEFMIRLAAVKRYGLEAMEAINRGLIDPQALQAILGRRARKHMAGISVRGPRGYVEGGKIQAVPGQTVQAAPSPTGSSGGFQPAFVVSSEVEMERLIAGGAPALEQFVLNMAPKIRAAGG